MEKGRMIWLMGKVYDLSETAVDEVEKDVEARLLSYTKCKMRVKIGLSEGYSVVSINRNIDADLEPDMLMDVDTFILSGEGYQGFVPVYSMTAKIPIPANAECSICKADFEYVYKKNFTYYTGQKIEKVYINEWPTMLTVRIKY